MKTYTPEQLQEILKKHAAWLRVESSGERANLGWADLRGADLGGADLRVADLRGADLGGASLRGADIGGAVDGSLARLDFGGWSICVRTAQTSIGCQTHANESWLSWLPESPEIVAMHKDAPEWWRVHGKAVKAVIRCVMYKAKKEPTE